MTAAAAAFVICALVIAALARQRGIEIGGQVEREEMVAFLRDRAVYLSKIGEGRGAAALLSAAEAIDMGDTGPRPPVHHLDLDGAN